MKNHLFIVLSLFLLAGISSGNAEQNTNTPQTKGIAEFDIHLPKDPTPADFELQGKMVAEIVKHAIRSPAVKTSKSWGLCDKYSWQPGKYNARPLMFDDDFRPKPAYTKLVEMLKTMKKETK